MTKYLITPSLLESFRFYVNYEGEKEDNIRSDFLRMLSRERSTPNEKMQKGIDFEERIYQVCKTGVALLPEHLISIDYYKNNAAFVKALNKLEPYCECVNAIAETLKGGIWQAKLMKDIEVNDVQYLLYGRSDVLKQNKIYDLKFSGSHEIGKYTSSSQHRIYLFCTGMPQFDYIISDGKDWFKETYFNHKNIEIEIKTIITEFINYINFDKEAKELFYSKWKSD